MQIWSISGRRVLFVATRDLRSSFAVSPSLISASLDKGISLLNRAMKGSLLPLLLLGSIGVRGAVSPPIEAAVTASWEAPALAVQYL